MNNQSFLSLFLAIPLSTPCLGLESGDLEALKHIPNQAVNVVSLIQEINKVIKDITSVVSDLEKKSDNTAQNLASFQELTNEKFQKYEEIILPVLQKLLATTAKQREFFESPLSTLQRIANVETDLRSIQNSLDTHINTKVETEFSKIKKSLDLRIGAVEKKISSTSKLKEILTAAFDQAEKENQ